MNFSSSLSARLFGGFLAVLALGVISAVITLSAISTLRGDDEARAAAFKQLRSAQLVDELLSDSRLAVADYFIRGDAASQQAALDILAKLKDGVGEQLSSQRAQQVQTLSKAVVDAAFKRLQASQDMVAAAGGLGNPITTLTEAGVRAGGAAGQAALDAQFAFSRLNASVARFAENEAERFVVETRDENVRLTAALAAIDGAPEATTRMKRLAGVAREQQAGLLKAFETLRAAGRARLDARAALEKELAAIDQDLTVVRDRAQASFDQAETRGGASLSRLSSLAIASGVALVVVGLALAGLIGRSLSRPILALQGAMGRIADGHLADPAPGAARKDEIGAMARAVDQFRQSLIHARGLEEEAKTRRAETAARRKQDLAELADMLEASIGDTVRAMRGAVGDLGSTAQQLSSLSAQAAREIHGLGDSASGAAASVESLAAASEELASSIAEVGRSAAAGSTTARDVTREADAAESHMRALAEAAERIGGVVDVISVIARHTNLLALNAMIESARAGEAGAGFAVVASEVKTLAHQTAVATEDIQKQIIGMQQMTRDAAGAIHEVIDRIRRVDQAVAGIAAAVDQQQATTGEIARNAQTAAMGADHVRSNISIIADGATQTDAAAAAVKTAADGLRHTSDRLGDDLSGVVSRLRAG